MQSSFFSRIKGRLSAALGLSAAIMVDDAFSLEVAKVKSTIVKTKQLGLADIVAETGRRWTKYRNGIKNYQPRGKRYPQMVVSSAKDIAEHNRAVEAGWITRKGNWRIEAKVR